MNRFKKTTLVTSALLMLPAFYNAEAKFDFFNKIKKSQPVEAEAFRGETPLPEQQQLAQDSTCTDPSFNIPSSNGKKVFEKLYGFISSRLTKDHSKDFSSGQAVEKVEEALEIAKTVGGLGGTITHVLEVILPNQKTKIEAAERMINLLLSKITILEGKLDELQAMKSQEESNPS